MNRSLALALTTASLVCSSATAAPKVVYWPATGRLILTTDSPTVVLGIESPSGALVAPPAGLIPRAVVDDYDIPYFLYYFNVPAGAFDLGNRVTPGVFLGDLTLRYFPTSLAQPAIIKPVDLAFLNQVEPPPFVLPEPNTLCVAGAGLAMLAALRRSK